MCVLCFVRWCNVCIDGFGRFLLEHLLCSAGGGTVTNTLLEAEDYFYYQHFVLTLYFQDNFLPM